MPLDFIFASTAELATEIDGETLAVRYSTAKRLLDVSVAVTALLLLSPFLLLVSIAIFLETGGPVLFRQHRTGFDGAQFLIYKFRTMNVAEDGPEIVQAEPNDGRATRVGRFLRRTSVDELPQLLNILRGEMSLVGPRPHAVAHDLYFGAALPLYRQRFLTKPGLTGLAQVNGLRGPTPNIASMAARVALDLTYIQTWSFALDLQILFRTLLIGPFDPAAL
jgi:lipopolysaccharide/colanic/teichoic acid biosynthesis glycosyltransferase